MFPETTAWTAALLTSALAAGTTWRRETAQRRRRARPMARRCAFDAQILDRHINAEFFCRSAEADYRPVTTAHSPDPWSLSSPTPSSSSSPWSFAPAGRSRGRGPQLRLELCSCLGFGGSSSPCSPFPSWKST